MDFWNEELRQAVHALIPEVEGRPGMNVGKYDGGVYVCRRISGLHTDEDSFNGQCEWADPDDARPDELTDAMSISCDCVRLGPGWWQDTYFGWYFVYDPELISRSLAGDHSWVQPFLDSAPPPVEPPATDLRGLAHRLLPPGGRPYLGTEDVVSRLRDKFAFFAAHPHRGPVDSGATAAKPLEANVPSAVIDVAAGQECTFSVVVADDMDSVDYLSFDVRPGDGILIGYRDERHRAAVESLVERCARLLDYDVFLQ